MTESPPSEPEVFAFPPESESEVLNLPRERDFVIWGGVVLLSAAMTYLAGPWFASASGSLGVLVLLVLQAYAITRLYALSTNLGALYAGRKCRSWVDARRLVIRRSTTAYRGSESLTLEVEGRVYNAEDVLGLVLVVQRLMGRYGPTGGELVEPYIVLRDRVIRFIGRRARSRKAVAPLLQRLESACNVPVREGSGSFSEGSASRGLVEILLAMFVTFAPFILTLTKHYTLASAGFCVVFLTSLLILGSSYQDSLADRELRALWCREFIKGP